MPNSERWIQESQSHSCELMEQLCDPIGFGQIGKISRFDTLPLIFNHIE